MKKIILSITLVMVVSSVAGAEDLSKEQILGQAEQRIVKYRTGPAELKLLDAAGKPLGEGLEIEINQKKHAFLFGCNIFKLKGLRTSADNAAYEKHYAELMNFATLPFYWWNYTREKDKPNDARTEEIIEWCQAQNILTKGHPLAWNYVDPRWLPDDAEKVMELQFDRISRCVKRFQNDIEIWDVVNEATHYDRDQLKQRSPKLTRGISKMGVGNYVRQAFAAARKANPGATLIINDYRTDPAFEKKVLAELVDKKGKALYDVIGIQSHMHGGYWGAKKTWGVCERYAKYGKPLHFTETTLVSGPRSKEGWNTTPEGEKKQAQDAVEFYTILFSHPAVEAITWWDFADQGAWQRAPAGFLRKDLTPKPMYHELKGLIKGKWWTQTEGKTKASGKTAFRGFFGEYEVSVTKGNKKLQGTFGFDKNTKDVIVVKLK